MMQSEDVKQDCLMQDPSLQISPGEQRIIAHLSRQKSTLQI